MILKLLAVVVVAIVYNQAKPKINLFLSASIYGFENVKLKTQNFPSVVKIIYNVRTPRNPLDC